jgi:hypothetical protein
MSTPRNQILSMLPLKDFGIIDADLESVALPLRMSLDVPNQHVEFCYFPSDAQLPRLSPGVRMKSGLRLV